MHEVMYYNNTLASCLKRMVSLDWFISRLETTCLFLCSYCWHLSDQDTVCWLACHMQLWQQCKVCY